MNSPPILEPILVVGFNRMFTGGTIWILSHGQMDLCRRIWTSWAPVSSPTDSPGPAPRSIPGPECNLSGCGDVVVFLFEGTCSCGFRQKETTYFLGSPFEKRHTCLVSFVPSMQRPLSFCFGWIQEEVSCLYRLASKIPKASLKAGCVQHAKASLKFVLDGSQLRKATDLPLLVPKIQNCFLFVCLGEFRTCRGWTKCCTIGRWVISVLAFHPSQLVHGPPVLQPFFWLAHTICFETI